VSTFASSKGDFQ